MKYFVIALLIALPLIYLNRTYAYFYDYQGDHFIGNPTYSQTHLFNTDEKFDTKKLVILGDSLMAGTGSTQEENSMAYLIAQDLATRQNVELQNLAHPGVGINDVLDRQLPEVIKIRPDYIVLMIGTNDVHNRMGLEEFNNKVHLLIGRLLSETPAKITVVNIPYLGSERILFRPWNSLLESRIQEFNNVLSAHVSIKKNIKLVDIYSKFKNYFVESSDLYAGDEFHPSDKGYGLWANYLNENLNR